MAGITTHVLDTARGKPAAHVPITLEVRDAAGAWSLVSRGATDEDGRLRDLTSQHEMCAASYRITFDTEAYFAALDIESHFYPRVSIEFAVRAPSEHFHVPLLISPFGYSTYRGS